MPRAHRRAHQQLPVGCQGRQPVLTFEQTTAALIGARQGAPVTVATLDQIACVVRQQRRFLGCQPADAAAGPGQIHRPQPVPGGPLQRLPLVHVAAQQAAVGALLRRQPLTPGLAFAGTDRHQPRGVDIPALAIPLTGQPQQGALEILGAVNLPDFPQPGLDPVPVIDAGRRHQYRREGRPQSPDTIFRAVGPESGGRLATQRSAEQRPGDAGALAFQLRQRPAGIEQALIAAKPAFAAAGGAECLQPFIQACVTMVDVAAQACCPATTHLGRHPSRRPCQGHQLKRSQQVGGRQRVRRIELEQAPPQFAPVGDLEGGQSLTCRLFRQHQGVRHKGPVAQHQLLSPPGIERINQVSPRRNTESGQPGPA